jgi:hypothetical protein
MCKKFGIMLSDIYIFNKEHAHEIEGIQGIFDLKNDNKEKVLALLYLLSLGEEDFVIQTFCKQTGFLYNEHSIANIIDQHKILLVSALAYHKTFYNSAIQYQGLVSAGFAIKEVEKNSFVASINSVGQSNVLPFNKSKSITLDEGRLAASSVEDGKKNVIE